MNSSMDFKPGQIWDIGGKGWRIVTVHERYVMLLSVKKRTHGVMWRDYFENCPNSTRLIEDVP